MEAGDLVCIDTPDTSDIDPNLVPGHCYASWVTTRRRRCHSRCSIPGGSTLTANGGKTWGSFISNGAFLEANFVTWGVAGTAAPGSGSANAILADSPGSDTIQRTNRSRRSSPQIPRSKPDPRPTPRSWTPPISSTQGPLLIGLVPTSPPQPAPVDRPPARPPGPRPGIVDGR